MISINARKYGYAEALFQKSFAQGMAWDGGTCIGHIVLRMKHFLLACPCTASYILFALPMPESAAVLALCIRVVYILVSMFKSRMNGIITMHVCSDQWFA